MKKAVFFDIDGTLWDKHMRVPESTVRGIRALRENGHYAFICSGRSRATIRAKELFDIGFDGVLAGCGTHVEYRKQTIFEYLLSQDALAEMLHALEEQHMPVILEGPEYLYADFEAFRGDSYVAYLRRILGDDLKEISLLSADSRINKMSAICTAENKMGIQKALGDRYELVFHESPVVEILPKGFSKASGIQRICGYLGIAHADTVGFGDSSNDLEMLRYVQVGIALGNGSEEAKTAADYVTAAVEEDGIYRALAHFALI